MRLLTNVTSLLSLNAALEGSSSITNRSANPDVSLSTPRIPLNDTVSGTVRQILATFVSAAFRELQITSTIGPTTDPELLLDVRLIFSYGRGVIYVAMTSIWGTWDPPRFFGEPWPAGTNVLPSRLVMDIVFADKLIKEAGYVEPYEAVYLRWPQGLSMAKEQPYYHFLLEGTSKNVYVGVNDQLVTTSLSGLNDDGLATA